MYLDYRNDALTSAVTIFEVERQRFCDQDWRLSGLAMCGPAIYSDPAGQAVLSQAVLSLMVKPSRSSCPMKPTVASVRQWVTFHFSSHITHTDVL